MKIARIAALVFALTALCGAGFAQISLVVNPPEQWTWDESSWQDCILDLELTWNGAALVNSSGGDPENHSWIATGPKKNDPTVNQKIKNNSASDEWSDWHVIIYNGTITSWNIRKWGSEISWYVHRSLEEVPNGDSITAIAIPGQTILPGDFLRVTFVFTPIDLDSPVTIQQWPTTDWVPEPTSIAALAMGVAAMGYSIRRKLS